MDGLTLLLCALAAYRVAYLIAVEDGPFEVAARVREAAERRYPPTMGADGYGREHWIVAGLACPLCVSFWAAPAVLLLHAWLPWLVWWLAVAGAVLVAHRWLEAR